jgi:hypothetical protein
MRGLIGRTDLPTGYGLVFPCCKVIHSFGMRVVRDARFLDERDQWRVIYQICHHGAGARSSGAATS